MSWGYYTDDVLDADDADDEVVLVDDVEDKDIGRVLPGSGCNGTRFHWAKPTQKLTWLTLGYYNRMA